MNSTTNNNNNLLNFDEIGELVKEIIRVAIDPTHNSIILTESYNGIDLSQLSGANLEEVRCSFSEIISDICGNVRANDRLTAIKPRTRNVFNVPDDNLEDTIVSFLRNFYKIYFSLAYKVRYDARYKPKGHVTEAVDGQLFDINPRFDPFEEDFLDNAFAEFYQFLSRNIGSIPYRDPSFPTRYSKRFKELAKVMRDLSTPKIKLDDPIDSESEAVKAFDACITDPVKSLLKIAGCTLETWKHRITHTQVENCRRERRQGEARNEDDESYDDILPINYLISDVAPDILVRIPNGQAVMFCEMKGHDFHQYKRLFGKDNKKLEADENFKDLMLQNSYYLICTGTDISFMSDFNCIVMLFLNFSRKDMKTEGLVQSNNSKHLSNMTDADYNKFREDREEERKSNLEKIKDKKEEKSSKVVHFKCKFIDNDTKGETIQSVFASILYRQLTREPIQQNRNSSKLCRTLTRRDFHMSSLYQKQLSKIKDIISSLQHPKICNDNKEIELNLNFREVMQIVSVNDDSNAQVLKIKNKTFNPKFIDDPSKTDETIIIKMYDIMSLNKLYDLIYFETYDSEKDFKRRIVEEWMDEVSRYQIITNYQKKNPKETIDVPQYFSHGILHIADGATCICGGLFIAMSYIEPMEYPRDSPGIDKLVMERFKHSVEKLAELNVKNNYISRDELIYHDKKLFLINFSNKFRIGNFRKGLSFDDLDAALDKIKSESTLKLGPFTRDFTIGEDKVNKLSTGELSTGCQDINYHEGTSSKGTCTEDSSNKSSKRRRV